MNEWLGWPEGHFYSPIPSNEDIKLGLKQIKFPMEFHGIPFNEAMQLTLAKRISQALGDFSLYSKVPGDRYFSLDSNGQFNHADATILIGMLALVKPSRVIEIGSGFSTLAMLDARRYFELNFDLLSIEPYPIEPVKLLDDKQFPFFKLIPNKVQEISLETFENLGKGDLLFIDSSHVVKIGSDVAYEILEIIPRLKPGVLIHFHDVFSGFQYPVSWTLEHKIYWNEIYFIRALLIGNVKLRIHFWPNHLEAINQVSLFQALPQLNGNTGGSLYLEVMD
jgi:hypothetical protein